MSEPLPQSPVTSAQSLLSDIVVRTFEPASTPRAAVIVPCAMGVARIGHFGFFRREFSETLWPLVRRWIESS